MSDGISIKRISSPIGELILGVGRGGCRLIEFADRSDARRSLAGRPCNLRVSDADRALLRRAGGRTGRVLCRFDELCLATRRFPWTCAVHPFRWQSGTHCRGYPMVRPEPTRRSPTLWAGRRRFGRLAAPSAATRCACSCRATGSSGPGAVWGATAEAFGARSTCSNLRAGKRAPGRRDQRTIQRVSTERHGLGVDSDRFIERGSDASEQDASAHSNFSRSWRTKQRPGRPDPQFSRAGRATHPKRPCGPHPRSATT